MRKTLALSSILSILGITVLLAAPVRSQRASAPTTLSGRIATASKVPEESVQKVLTALGPAVRAALASGQTLDLPGLGQFRVVRVAAHKDLVNGRPTTVPESNTVEFLAASELGEASNSQNAQPAETVPAFEYTPLPNQTKGLKTGSTPRTQFADAVTWTSAFPSG